MRAIAGDWQTRHSGRDSKTSAIPQSSIMGLPAFVCLVLGLGARSVPMEKGTTMRVSRVLQAAVSLAALGCALPAHADVLPFTGSLTARAVTGADPACTPSLRGVISPGDTVGTSSLGAFTYGHTVCTAGAVGGPVTGVFNIDFGSDGFQGTLAGTATPTAMPPVSDLSFLYTIVSGTGRFLGATGTFTGIGMADPRIRPSTVTLDFNGAIDAPAVPEPATWALLIVGFGMIGGSLRSRSTRPAMA